MTKTVTSLDSFPLGSTQICLCKNEVLGGLSGVHQWVIVVLPRAVDG